MKEAKTDTEVLIRGRIYTLSGYESEEYLQKVALYINNKFAEYNKNEAFSHQSTDTQSVLLELNIADDYFKAKKQIDAMDLDSQEKDKEIYDLKHDLISTQMKLDTAQQQVTELKDKLSDAEKKITELQAQLKNRK